MPPLAAAIMKFNQDYEYSWHTPGHAGGTAFLKSPIGRIFFDYFGENLLRADLSISVGSSGLAARPHGPDRRAREIRRARVRRAPHVLRHERHVDVEPRDLHGGRGARPDRAVRPQLPQVDRAQPGHDRAASRPISCRCAIATGSSGRSRRRACARTRSRPRSRTTRWSERHRQARRVLGRHQLDLRRPLLQRAARARSCSTRASTAFISTKPGTRTRASIRCIATAMRCTAIPKDHKGPTVFATHSTHKLLAALSQASFLHIRDGRGAIPHSRFNESFMMQASTSPLYPIIVSNDITAAMMDGPGGPTLTDRIDPGSRVVPADHGPRAPTSSRRRRTGSSRPGMRTRSRAGSPARKSASRTHRRSSSRPIRSAGCCIPAKPGTASTISKTTTACSTRSRCRSSRPESPTRAASTRAAFRRRSSPAYLHQRGVEVEKTTDFTILVLFSIGITKGKWGTLLNALLDFKRDYDSNAPLARSAAASRGRPPGRLRRARPARARRPDVRAAARCAADALARARRSRRCRRRS